MENQLAIEDAENYIEHLEHLIHTKVIEDNTVQLYKIAQYFVNGTYVAACLAMIKKSDGSPCFALIKADDEWTTTMCQSFAALYDNLKKVCKTCRYTYYSPTKWPTKWSAVETGTLEL